MLRLRDAFGPGGMLCYNRGHADRFIRQLAKQLGVPATTIKPGYEKPHHYLLQPDMQSKLRPRPRHSIWG